jgi:hypothetical protein
MLTIRHSQMQEMAAISPNTKLKQPCPKDGTWIEVRLVDQEGNAVPGERYQIRLPDASLMEGMLDDTGKVRFEDNVPGQAIVTFPEIDARGWNAKTTGPS